jgi:hypothetical protein
MPKDISKPFLGATTSVNEAFPGIEEIDITIEQDTYGYYCQHQWQRISHFTKSTIPRHMHCVNPRCQQGGVDLQSFVLSHSNGEFDISCNGHEGSPAGRRKGDPCDNHFKIKLNITRTKKL